MQSKVYPIFICFILVFYSSLNILRGQNANNCANAITLTTSGALETNMAQFTNNETTCEGSLPDIWFKFNTEDKVLFTFNSYQSQYNGSFVIYEGTCGSLNPIYCGTTFDINTTVYNHRINNLVPQTTYYIRFYDSDNELFVDYFSYTSDSYPAQANDECIGATVVALALIDLPPTIINDESRRANPSLFSDPGIDYFDKDLWYQFTTTSSGTFEVVWDGDIDFTNKMDSTKISFFSGACGGLSYIESTALLTKNASLENRTIRKVYTPNTTYYMRVMSQKMRGGPFTLSFKEGPLPDGIDCASSTPIIVQQGATCIAFHSNILYWASPSSLPNPSCASGNINSKNYWYSFVAPSTGAVKVKFDFIVDVLTLYGGSCGSVSELECSSLLSNNQHVFSGLTNGSTYYLRMQNSTDDLLDVFSFCILEGPPPIANDSCNNAIDLSVNSTSCSNPLSTHNFYTTAESGIGDCGSTNDVWFKFDCPSTGAINIDISNNDESMQAFIYEGSCGNLSSITQCEIAIGDLYGLVPGQSYYLRVGPTYSNKSSYFDICIEELPTVSINNFCHDATPLTVETGPFCSNLSTANFTSIYDLSYPNNTCSINKEKDMWYYFAAPPSGTVTLQQISGSGSLELFDDCMVGMSPLGCSNMNGEIAIPGLITGQDYYLRVTSGASENSSLVFCVREVPSPPQNDLCENATPLLLSSSNCDNIESGTTIEAYKNIDFCVNTTSGEVFYEFNPPLDNNYKISTLNGTEPLNIEVLSSCAGLSLGCGPDSITTFLEQGFTYYIAVSAVSPSGFTPFDICIKEYEFSNDSIKGVGIGVSVPNQKLSVDGAISISNSEEPISGSIRYNGDFEGFSQGQWNSLTNSTAATDNLGNHMATQHLEMQNNKIRNLSAPQLTTDAATKAYVDSHSDGDASSSNEIQYITKSGNILTLSNGGGNVTLDGGGDWSNLTNVPAGFADDVDNVNDADFSSSNELNTLFKITNHILFLEDNGGSLSVNLNPYLDNTDDWENTGNNISYNAGKVLIGTTTASPNVLSVDGGISVAKNSGSNPQLDLREYGYDYSRIDFTNTSQTDNKWTLEGRASNDSTLSSFHVKHSNFGNVATYTGDGRLSMGVASPLAQIHTNAPSTIDPLRVEVNGSTKLRIFSNGSVVFGNATGVSPNDVYINSDLGLGVTNPLAKLHVGGTVIAEGLMSTKTIQPSVDNTNNCGKPAFAWKAVHAYSYPTVSDKRAKQNISNIPYDLRTLMALQPKIYEYINAQDEKRIGLLAQDVKELIPEVVDDTNPDHLSIRYSDLIPVLIKGIQELNEEKEALSERVDRLEKMILELSKEEK